MPDLAVTLTTDVLITECHTDFTH